MSWLVKAFTMSQRGDEYFLLTDPLLFYEIKYTNTIPAGTEVSRYLPPSDIFASDIILSSAKLSPENIDKGVLTSDVKSGIVLKIGKLTTPIELFQKYIRLDDDFRRKLHSFKDTSLSQQYLVSKTDKPKLYRISQGFDNTAKIECYGTLKDIAEQSSEMRKALSDSASKKTGRSYETADWRRVENIYTYMENSLIPLDPAKMAFILRKSNIKPISSTEEQWLDCFTNLDKEAQTLRDKIRHFHSLRWVQSMTNPSMN